MVFKCRVGCSQEQVVAALKERGLWTQPPQQRVPRAKTDRSRGPKPSSPIDYLIKRPDGELVAIHRRFDSPGGPKFFAWFQPGGGVSGLNGLPAAELPLYRGETLADLIIQAPVTVVEGEKAADHLAACLDGAQVGVLATVGGAATVPTDGVLAALADRRVVLWPDNDEPGQRHMDQVAAGLQRVGAAEVKFASWPDAPERGDAADYVAEHSRGELLELLKAARPVPAGKSLPGGDFEKDQLDQLVPVAGDFLNAERFLTVYGDDIRWVPELRAYFIWNGSRWEEDRTDRAPAAAQETISKLRPWAAEEGIAESEAKRRFSHYLASAKGGRAEALLAVARTRIAIGIKDLDQHPYLLAAKGATIDLRSGEVKDPDRADLITRGSDHEYHPDAKGDNWVKVLETTFGGDQELIQYFQRLMGYASTGVVAEHVCPVFYGRGGNGRSTILGAISDILGELAMVAPDGLFIAQTHPQHPERIASLRGRRLVISFELESKPTLAEGLVKTLTGGDRLTAREIQGRRFEFAPTHKVGLVCNHKPRVTGTDEGIWRRLQLMPFEHQIPPGEVDGNLRQKLVQREGEAILAWLVQGAVAWARDGLGQNPTVQAASEAYRASQDSVGLFLSEQTQPARTDLAVKDLWAKWVLRCQETNERPGRQQDFSAALEEHGIKLGDHQNKRFAKNLDWADSDLGRASDVPLVTPHPLIPIERELEKYRDEGSRGVQGGTPQGAPAVVEPPLLDRLGGTSAGEGAPAQSRAAVMTTHSQREGHDHPDVGADKLWQGMSPADVIAGLGAPNEGGRP